jgi:hypothetical protein
LFPVDSYGIHYIDVPRLVLKLPADFSTDTLQSLFGSEDIVKIYVKGGSKAMTLAFTPKTNAIEIVQ